MSVIAKYGYEGLFLILFLEAVGIPIPGALALLIAGAACASRNMRLSIALPVSVVAMLAGALAGALLLKSSLVLPLLAAAALALVTWLVYVPAARRSAHH